VDSDWSAEKPNVPETIVLRASPIVSGTVVDAETGKPVTDFTAQPAWYTSGDTRASLLQFNESKHVRSAEGKFSLRINNFGSGADDPPLLAARIVARGYVPQYTPGVKIGSKAEPVTIRLKKGEPIDVNVLRPDGAPAIGARGAFVGAGHVALIEDLNFNTDITRAPESIAITDTAGKLELPAAEGAGRLVVVHESGYAVAEVRGLKIASALRLTAWAKVSGAVKIDGKPLASAEVNLQDVKPIKISGDGRIDFNRRATTDEQGRFSIARVPAWEQKLSVRVGETVKASAIVQPKAGEAVDVNPGEVGRR